MSFQYSFDADDPTPIIRAFRNGLGCSPETFIRSMFPKSIKDASISISMNRDGDLIIDQMDFNHINSTWLLEISSRTASLRLMEIPQDKQGKGIARSLLASSVRTFREKGFKSLSLDASFTIGSYAWARYGFLPEQQKDWDLLRENFLKRAFRKIERQVSPTTHKIITRSIASPDRESIWLIAGLDEKVTHHTGMTLKVGQSVLFDSLWSGILDFSNEKQMAIFNAYTERLSAKPGTSSSLAPKSPMKPKP